MQCGRAARGLAGPAWGDGVPAEGRWRGSGPQVPSENGAPDRIRTCGLRLRRPTLYPAELRAHDVDCVL